jgi:uncharacterized protein
MIVYDVRVTLLGAEPPVWRLVRVPADAQLSLVHSVLQLAMGWEDYHLHEFVGADRKRYGVVDDEYIDVEVLDEQQYPLSALLGEPGDRCLYVYDFGDDWVHELKLESVSEPGPGDEPIWCLDGAGACPPEDCGGVPGYAALLESLRDRTDGEHADAVELLGEEFDPEAFDCADFNDQVRDMYQEEPDMLAPEAVTEAMGVLIGLRDLLESEGMPDGAMSVMSLNGFFSALAIHPVTVMPNTWLPWVWDISGACRQPEFASQQAAEKGMGLLFTYFNSVVRQLTDDPEGYEPLYEELQIEPDEARMLAAEDWASGFMLGVMIDEEVWNRTFGDENGRLVLAPFAMMSGLFDEAAGSDEEQLAKMKEELVDELGFTVVDLQEFWAPWRQEYLTRQDDGRTERSESRIGRNEPCPCGSGKKYKQCCGR